VPSGTPLASKSYYSVNPVRGKWAEPYVAYAGAEYKVNVVLLDRDGSGTTPTPDDIIAVFYTPTDTPNTITITPDNGLYHNPNDLARSNIDSGVVVTDLSLLYGASSYTFTFIPTRASSAAQFAIYLLEKSTTGPSVWKRITGAVPATDDFLVHPSTQTIKIGHGAPRNVFVSSLKSDDFLLIQ